MKAFIGLVKKDMLLARLGYILWLIGTALLLISGYISAVRSDEPFLVLPFLFATIIMHVGFAPVATLSLLRVEGKTQLWLYNPQGSMKLLLAKFTTVSVFLAISQWLTSIGAYALIKWMGAHGVRSEWIALFSVKHFFLLNTALFAGSLYLSIWIAFLWVVFHSLSQYPVLRKIRALVIIGIIIAANLIETLFMQIDALRSAVLRWDVNITSLSSIQFNENIGLEFNSINIALPVLPVIIYTVLALLLFYTASVLLDKKVEV